MWSLFRIILKINWTDHVQWMDEEVPMEKSKMQQLMDKILSGDRRAFAH